jgi:hypothetical protein
MKSLTSSDQLPVPATQHNELSIPAAASAYSIPTDSDEETVPPRVTVSMAKLHAPFCITQFARN